MRMIIPRRGTAAAAAVRTAVDVAVGAAVRVAEVDAVVVVEEEAVADAAVEEGRERGFLRSGRPPARSFVVRKSPFFFSYHLAIPCATHTIRAPASCSCPCATRPDSLPLTKSDKAKNFSPSRADFSGNLSLELSLVQNRTYSASALTRDCAQ